jgi:hypothetical protein
LTSRGCPRRQSAPMKRRSAAARLPKISAFGVAQEGST